MNVDSVVRIPWGGGDTQTCPNAKEPVAGNLWHECSQQSHLVEFPLPNFSAISFILVLETMAQIGQFIFRLQG